MTRFVAVGGLWLVAIAAAMLSASVSLWWLLAAVPLVALAVIGSHDLLQRRHNVLRNYPVVGHLRFALEDIRPEIQQYFIETDTSGRPFDRDIRSLVYERAKGMNEEKPYG